jgi:hypothetical protein
LDVSCDEGVGIVAGVASEIVPARKVDLRHLQAMAEQAIGYELLDISTEGGSADGVAELLLQLPDCERSLTSCALRSLRTRPLR